MAKSLKKKKKTTLRRKTAARKPRTKKAVAKRKTAKRKTTRKTAAKKRATKKIKKAKKTTRKKTTRKKTKKKSPARKKSKKTTKKAPKKAPKKPAKKTASKAKKQFVYNLYDLKPSKDPASGTIIAHRKLSGKSTTEACQLTGDQMLIGIAHKRRGTGSKFHTHPNEQFNFVLKGTLRVDIGDQTFYCPAGSVAHIPAGVVHSTCATGDEDVMFFVCKDTRHGISGPPIDGKEDGARYLPGFEPTEGQREKDAGFDPIPTKS
jgi:quercetin dioxygenase-like cupin family protein